MSIQQSVLAPAELGRPTPRCDEGCWLPPTKRAHTHTPISAAAPSAAAADAACAVLPEINSVCRNAGTWMGTAHAVRCAMSAIHLSFDDHGFLFTDDQWVFANAFLASSKTSHPIIALDYQADVFASLYDNTQGGFDSFVPKDWECVEGKG